MPLEHPRVAGKSGLGAVAVMDVEIDNRDPLQAMHFQRVARGNRDVVEKAEAHGAGRFRMVARRPHAAECIVITPFDHRVGGGHRSAGGAQRGLPRMRIHRRIRVDLGVALVRRTAADVVDVRLGMHAQQRGLVGQRR
jgi:hypothetical protein